MRRLRLLALRRGRLLPLRLGDLTGLVALGGRLLRRLTGGVGLLALGRVGGALLLAGSLSGLRGLKARRIGLSRASPLRRRAGGIGVATRRFFRGQALGVGGLALRIRRLPRRDVGCARVIGLADEARIGAADLCSRRGRVVPDLSAVAAVIGAAAIVIPGQRHRRGAGGDADGSGIGRAAIALVAPAPRLVGLVAVYACQSASRARASSHARCRAAKSARRSCHSAA